MRYVIEHPTVVGGWQPVGYNDNDTICTYQTLEEAEAALTELLQDMDDAVHAGHLQDYEINDWRVAPIE